MLNPLQSIDCSSSPKSHQQTLLSSLLVMSFLSCVCLAMKSLFLFFCMLRIVGGLCIKQATSHRAPVIDVNPLKLKQNICTCFTNRKKMCHCKILGQYMNAWPSLVHNSFDVSKAGPQSVFLRRSYFCKARGELRVSTVAYKPIITQVISLISGPLCDSRCLSGKSGAEHFPPASCCSLGW